METVIDQANTASTLTTPPYQVGDPIPSPYTTPGITIPYVSPGTTPPWITQQVTYPHVSPSDSIEDELDVDAYLGELQVLGDLYTKFGDSATTRKLIVNRVNKLLRAQSKS